MNRFITTATAVLLLLIALAGSVGATNPDPYAVRPWEYRSESRMGDDGGWVVPPAEAGRDKGIHILAGFLCWTPELGQQFIINYFLNTGEVNNGTNTNESTDAHRPVDQR